MGYPPPPPGQPPVPPHYGYGYQPPPQWRPPPQIDPAELRPGRFWYWLSPIPAVVGVLVAALFIVMLVDRVGEDLERFTGLEPLQVQLEQGKERGIYAEDIGVRSPGASGVSGSCTVRDAATEESVPLSKPSGTFTITTGGDHFTEQYYFKPPRDGVYLVSCPDLGASLLAVGPHFGFEGVAYPIIGMILAFLIGIGLSATILIVTLVKRSNHKKRLQQERTARGY